MSEKPTGCPFDPPPLPLGRSRVKRRLFEVTVHVGTDQNFEIEIFAECKSTLNELLEKMFFDTSNSWRDMTNESFYRK